MKKIFAFVIAAGISSVAISQNIYPYLGTDNPNSSATKSGEKIIVGGYFSNIGITSNGFSLVTTANGKTICKSEHFTNLPISCAEPDDKGGYYIGGEFNKIGYYHAIPKIAHVLANGNVDSTFIFTLKMSDIYSSSTVTKLYKMGDTLIVFGVFDSINGLYRNNLCAINLKNNSVLNWAPKLTGTINDILATPSFLYLGGNIQRFNNHLVANLVQLNRSNFSYVLSGGTNSEITTMVLDSGKIVMKGNYSVSGWKNPGILQLDSADVTRVIGKVQVNGTVYSAKQSPDGYWYLAGEFTISESSRITNLIKLNSDLSIDTTFGFKIAGRIYDFDFTDSLIFAGGFNLISVNSLLDTGIFIINYKTKTKSMKRLNALSEVDKIVIHKDILIYNSTQYGIVKVDIKTLTEDRSFPNGKLSFAVDSSFVYLADGNSYNSKGKCDIGIYDKNGNFSQRLSNTDLTYISSVISDNNGGYFIGGSNGLRHILSNGKLDQSLSLKNGEIKCLLLKGDTLFIGGRIGSFSFYNSSSSIIKNNFIALNIKTKAVSPFNIDINKVSPNYYDGNIYNMHRIGDTLLLLGYINSVGTTAPAKPYLYNLKIHIHNFGYAKTVNKFNYITYGAYIDDSSVYYAGVFKRVDGQKRYGLSKISRMSGKLEAWSPALSDTNYFSTCINGDDSFIYAGLTNGSNAYLTKIKKSNGQFIKFGNALDSTFSSSAIKTIQLQKDTVYLGGNFTFKYKGKTYTNLLKYNKRTGIIYDYKVNLYGSICYIDFKTGGKLVLGGDMSNIDAREQTLIVRHNLTTGLQDSWQVAYPEMYISFARSKLAVTKNSIYFLNPGFYNQPINGVKRNYLYKFSKQDGKFQPFNAKFGIGESGMFEMAYIGNKIYTSNNSGLYEIQEGIDSFRKIEIGIYNTSIKIFKGIKSDPVIFGGFEFYNSKYDGRSFDGTQHRFAKGMNSYPGTCACPTQNAYSSIVANVGDSIYFYVDQSNKMNITGNVYRLNVKTKAITKMNFYVSGVNKIIHNGNYLYLIGLFNGYTYNNTLHKLSNIVRYDITRNIIDTTFRPQPNGEITDMVPLGSDLGLVGKHNLINSKPVGRLGIFNLEKDSALGIDFGIEHGQNVYHLAAKDSLLFAAGNIYKIKSTFVQNLVMLNLNNGKLLHDFNLPFIPAGLFVNKEYLYMWGNFKNLNNSGKNYIVRYNIATKAIDNWNPKLNGTPRRLVADDSFIYCTGYFDSADNKKTVRFAKIDKITGALKNSNLNFRNLDKIAFTPDLKSLLVTDKLLYISGFFYYKDTYAGVAVFDKNTLELQSYKTEVDYLNVSGDFDFIAQFGDKLLTNSNNRVNGVKSGNLVFLDKYSPITYPYWKNKIAIGYQSYSSMASVVDKTVVVASQYNFTFNNVQSGNLLVITDGSENEKNAITSFSPMVSGNTGEVSITVKGNNLDKVDNIYLQRGTKTIVATAIKLIDQNKLVARFSFNNDSIGAYKLVANFSNSGLHSASNNFNLKQNKKENIELNIIGFNQIRPNRWGNYKVMVENKGNTDLINLPVHVFLSKKAKVKWNIDCLSGDSMYRVNIDTFNNKAFGGATYSAILPRLNVGGISYLSFQISANSGDSLTISAWHNQSISTSGRINCLTKVWKYFSGTNLQNSCTNKSLNKLDSLFEVKNRFEFGAHYYKGDLTIEYANSLKNCGFTSNNTYLQKFAKFCSNPTYLLNIDSSCIHLKDTNYSDSTVFIPLKLKSKLVTVINSLDPNDKVGPEGELKSGIFKELPEMMEYVIRFENSPTATAPAQIVTVRDTIDKKYLDINNVEFTGFGVGDFKYEFIEGTKFVKNKLFDFRKERNVILDFSSTVDTGKGIISWDFNSLDIASLSVDTLNPLFGFLPPNNKAGKGEGYVSFRIKRNLISDSFMAIKNRASIVFDENKQILTPYWTVKQDKSNPISSVFPLASTQTDTNIIVSWKATDQTKVKQIRIFYSTSNSNYKLWLISNADSSATLRGKQDSSYYFYSVAEDIVGNVEPIPSSYDAKTTIIQKNNNNSVKNTADSKLKIFPNPSDGEIKIQNDFEEKLKLSISTLDGRLIDFIDVKQGSNTVTLETKGIYIFSFFNGNKSIGNNLIVVK